MPRRQAERPRARRALQDGSETAGATGGDCRGHPAERGAGRADRAALRLRGIVVSDTLQTVTDPRIYAIGECAAHRGVAYGLVAPLFEQARVCATHLAEFGIGRYTGSQMITKLKVTGIDLFSAGDFAAATAARRSS